MIRIRYTKRDKLLVSGLFTVGPNLVIKAVVFPDLHGEVLDIQGHTIDYVTGKNSRQVKQLLRQSLINLGLKLDGEIRNK